MRVSELTKRRMEVWVRVLSFFALEKTRKLEIAKKEV